MGLFHKKPNLEKLYKKGMEYLNAKDYANAYKCFEEAADKGYIDAQYQIGFLYYHGYGVTKNADKAMPWLRRAASQSHPMAQYYLAVMHYLGVGLPLDHEKALKLAKKAVDQGVSAAKDVIRLIEGAKDEQEEKVSQEQEEISIETKTWFEQGDQYYEEEKYDDAYVCFEKDAELGSAISMYYLGVMCSNGEGVDKDLNKARVWFKRAETAGYEEATEAIKTINQIEINERIDINNAACEHALAKRYTEALELFIKAADLGDADAMVSIGGMYCIGDGVTKDSSKAIEWFKKAAEFGNAGAYFNLALCYQAGDGVPQDIKTAIKYYKMAAEKNDEEAMLTLGEIYKNGEDVAKNPRLAQEWFEKAWRVSDDTDIPELWISRMGNKEYYEFIERKKKKALGKK